MARSSSRQRKLPKRRRRPTQETPNDHIAHAEKIETALALQRAGELEQAKEIYCQVLTQDPNNSDAWHLLGMVLYSASAYPNALECLEKAHSLVGDHPELLGHLALVHHALGNDDRARAIYEVVLQTLPNDVNARNNYGVFLLEQGDLPEAESQFQEAIRIDPGSQQAHMNRANCLVRQNRLHDAEEIYRSLLQENADNLDVQGNLGECLRRQCKWQEAAETLQNVVGKRPGDLVSRMTLARTLVNQGRFDEAKSRFADLVREYPDYAKARHYLGTTLLDLKDFAGAESAMQSALAIDPNDSHALCSLGFLYIETDRRREAVDCFSRAVQRDPSMSEAHGCLLYLMSGDPEISPDELYHAHVRWGEMHGNVASVGQHLNRRDVDRRLRIGYASGDLREHAVAVFFEPLLRLRDRSQFEVFCYSESGKHDHVTDRLQQLSDHWRVTLGYSDDQVAQMVHEDQIDILVDLSGHTAGNRLTAWARKPAPIQISWLGYPNTTGLKAIDYSLTCDVQNPVDEPTLHTEQLLRIPGGSFCFAPPQDAPELSPLPAIKKGHITFGSLHRPFKVSSKTHDLWASALKACPDATLIAFNTRFNDALKHELVAALTRRGIDESRIEVRSTYRGDSYLETYREIDIGLDATPWAGGTTTMEALWMGVPVIAYYGNNRPSRGTAGIVHHLGKPEWIARSTQQYAELVASLAGDLDELASLRRSLREMTLQTISDEQRFVSELEKSYRQVWTSWCKSGESTKAPAPPLTAITHPSATTDSAGSC